MKRIPGDPKMKRFMVLLAALCIGDAGAADLAAGQAKAKEVCAACHGLDGNSQVADYPKLGGQYPDYLAKALRDYKSGLRKNPIMAGMVGTLSARDIDNVAAYYANQPPTVHTPNY
ncbi:MAG: cytochrome c [Betaproteobacteria bacterium]